MTHIGAVLEALKRGPAVMRLIAHRAVMEYERCQSHLSLALARGLVVRIGTVAQALESPALAPMVREAQQIGRRGVAMSQSVYALTGTPLLRGAARIDHHAAQARMTRASRRRGSARNGQAGALERVLAAMAEEDGLTSDEIAARAGLDLHVGRRALQYMVKHGGVRTAGPRQAPRYFLFKPGDVQPIPEGSPRFAGRITIGRQMMQRW